MSIFNVSWRELFKQVQPPEKRADQTLDLGESYLTTLATDSAALDALNTTLQTEKKYNCVKMVMEASLDEIFGETTFQVETETNPIRETYFFTAVEYENQFLRKENEEENG